MWPTEPEGHTKTLGTAHHDVRAEFPRRGQEGQSQQIRRHDRHGTQFVGLIDDRSANGAAGPRIAHDDSRRRADKWLRCEINDVKFGIDGLCAGRKDSVNLRMEICIDNNAVARTRA